MKLMILLFLFVNGVFSQSLWTDRNPYSAGQDIKKGSIVRVVIKEGVKGEYTYESGKDDLHTIKANPDKKIVTEMQGFFSDRSIARRQNGKAKSKGNIIGSMSTIVQDIEPETGLLILSGSRSIIYDNGIGQSVLTIKGKASPVDMKGDRTITSDLVADLEITYQAAPQEKKLDDLQLKNLTTPDGKPTVKAQLSEEEKQKILLEHIKRILGESQ